MPIKLLGVRNDLKRRFEDIDTMIYILNSNEKVDNQLILKSSLMLMLYNAVEGTMSNLLTDFFDIIHKKNILISSLPYNLQTTICNYWSRKNDSVSSTISVSNTTFELSYDELTKYLKLFSGNLDSRSIRTVSESLGISLPDNVKEPFLLIVKNSRNKLAHGETRFNNACQDITLKKMNDIRTNTQVFLESVILHYELFLNSI